MTERQISVALKKITRRRHNDTVTQTAAMRAAFHAEKVELDYLPSAHREIVDKDSKRRQNEIADQAILDVIRRRSKEKDRGR